MADVTTPPTSVRGSESTGTTPTTTTNREDAVRELLANRAKALRTKNRSSFLATVDQELKAVATQQRTLFDDMSEVPFSKLELDFAGEGPALSSAQQASLGAGAWVAKVVLRYRIEGADTADVRHEQYLTVRQTGRHVKVVGAADGPSEGVQRDLWDLGKVHLVRGENSLVLGTDASQLGSVAERVDKAAGRVDTVWGTGWPRTVVVLVPKNQTQLAQLLGRSDESGLNQIAAVTTGEAGLPMGQAADRVIVNPDQFDPLPAAAAQFVLTHEVTHVATRASGSGKVPTWFTEGFADYVASSTAGFSLHRTSPDVLARVAETGRAPKLPTDNDFDAGHNDDVASTYSAAFLAVSYIDRKWGRAAVLELYRAQLGDLGPNGAASTPVSLEQAMPRVLGVSVTDFEQGFQQFVEDVARDQNQ